MGPVIQIFGEGVIGIGAWRRNIVHLVEAGSLAQGVEPARVIQVIQGLLRGTVRSDAAELLRLRVHGPKYGRLGLRSHTFSLQDAHVVTTARLLPDQAAHRSGRLRRLGKADAGDFLGHASIALLGQKLDLLGVSRNASRLGEAFNSRAEIGAVGQDATRVRPVDVRELSRADLSFHVGVD